MQMIVCVLTIHYLHHEITSPESAIDVMSARITADLHLCISRTKGVRANIPYEAVCLETRFCNQPQWIDTRQFEKLVGTNFLTIYIDLTYLTA